MCLPLCLKRPCKSCAVGLKAFETTLEGFAGDGICSELSANGRLVCGFCLQHLFQNQAAFRAYSSPDCTLWQEPTGPLDRVCLTFKQLSLDTMESFNRVLSFQSLTALHSPGIGLTMQIAPSFFNAPGASMADIPGRDPAALHDVDVTVVFCSSCQMKVCSEMMTFASFSWCPMLWQFPGLGPYHV